MPLLNLQTGQGYSGASTSDVVVVSIKGDHPVDELALIVATEVSCWLESRNAFRRGCLLHDFATAALNVVEGLG